MLAHVRVKRAATQIVAVFVGTVLTSFSGSPARASGGQLRIFQDDRLLQFDGPATRDATLDTLASLGVQVVRVSVAWRSLEPTGPSVSTPRWAALDGLVAAAEARGLRPLLTLSSPAPGWAAGTVGQFHSLRPNPAAYGRFVAAVGRRYDGRGHPRVDLWALWNEPNHPEFLTPQRTRSGQLVAPALLRRLLRAGGAALTAAGHASDTILVGEWLPVGSDGACVSCTQKPLVFARELLCLDDHNHPFRGRAARRHQGCTGRFAQLPGTAWSVHPYARSGLAPEAPPLSANDIAPAGLGRLRTLLAAAARAGRVRARMRLWETEDGVQTNPPDRRVGVSLEAQARDVDEAEWLAWRLPYVASVAQYALRDDAQLSGFQSGLLFADGRPKPSLAAYRLPLVVVRPSRRSSRVDVWMRLPPGQRHVTVLPPSGRPVRIAVSPGGGYLTRRLVRRACTCGPWQLRLDDGTLSRRADELR
jgi:hypothetical protein